MNRINQVMVRTYRPVNRAVISGVFWDVTPCGSYKSHAILHSYRRENLKFYRAVILRIR
jgi:hypothetical protein